ncbi:MAG: MerR family transcriptional regulator [Acidimicrobiales bacterium]|nr:MAG: MerR family transcriptional regulator [Acidimicrobiales bacterium]
MPDSAPPIAASVAGQPSTSGGHLSIGEVLALLLEEFPDVTISKIRFLESQGLIDPERTASGYRKFYGDDVELLRCILREQRENYLPLRVIKDRIDSGEIDPTNEHPRPRGIKNVSETADMPRPDSHPSAGGVRRLSESDVAAASAPHESGEAVTGAAVLFQRTDAPVESPPAEPTPPTPPQVAVPAVPPAGAVLPGLLLTADELCAMAGLTHQQLADLQSYGVVASQSTRPDGPFDEDAVEIATVSKRLLDAGLEPRHLRGWRVAADREVGLLEQLIQPLLRQRNPEARAQAIAQLSELESVGGRLRAAMMRSSLRQHGGH